MAAGVSARSGCMRRLTRGMLQAEDDPEGHTPADYEDIVAAIGKDAAAF